ncbi:L-serine ammonia-lyase [Neisseria sp. Ec49-e6-T10]|uniref:L-serine ammonia-lyase n=1 Tax=Neisseria sp. Ec49-e6-T10 TaxID=3140744 RepID=UPI003EBCDEDF
MMISIFELFKIGIGPSSSHTVGPMKAGNQFCQTLHKLALTPKVTTIQVDIYGSLALTGKGHRTDIAIILGLAGFEPATVDVDAIDFIISDIEHSHSLMIGGSDKHIAFDTEKNITFHYEENLPLHENGLKIEAFGDTGLVLSKVYYSIGGGFIVEEEQFNQPESGRPTVPYPFDTAEHLLQLCQQHQYTIDQLVYQNELSYHTAQEIEDYFVKIWQTMQQCIQRGIHSEGVLPGPLQLPKRAAPLYHLLISSEESATAPLRVMDWVNMFALAVNEENAAGGRIVTAPTNGASGIIPAVLSYYHQFIQPLTPELIIRFFMSSGAIGTLYKKNASISGAEVGCQGEVGVACSMAAAGLADLLGGSAEQICIAAEIGMEHNLGLTCDPVAGQVQIPCIERNAIASMKAINAARMALQRTSSPSVSLDKVIQTMFETGRDLNAKYRETSLGGLASIVIAKVQC